MSQNQNETRHPFDYTLVELPEDCTFKISPSSISKFFEYPVVWYKDQILGEQQFTGNTSSVLGSIVHGLAERFAKNEPSDRTLVETYLRKYLLDPKVNCQEIRDLYPDMAKTLINEYVSKNKPTEVEQSLIMKVKDGIYVAGTCDNLTGNTVVDYKNVSMKPADTIPWNYYVQLMAYAKMYKETKGVQVDRIRLVYVVRPTKTLPVRLFVVNQTIGDSDYKAIDDVLTLISDTVLLSRAHPELNYLLFKSMQLKEQKNGSKNIN